MEEEKGHERDALEKGDHIIAYLRVEAIFPFLDNQLIQEDIPGKSDKIAQSEHQKNDRECAVLSPELLLLLVTLIFCLYILG